MLANRVVPCLDVDGGRVVKGQEFLNLRDMGDPVELARRYEANGADELVFLDISATIENRSSMVDLARRTAENVFIPFTIGGGVRSKQDVQSLLDAGADKVAVNSAALTSPQLIDELAAEFGSQCAVLAIDAKRTEQSDNWDVYSAGGRCKSGRQAVEWAKEAIGRGAGEILLTSIDRDGTTAGYDLDLLKAVSSSVEVPVIASGGAGNMQDFADALECGEASAVLAASVFHSEELPISGLKNFLRQRNIPVRRSQPYKENFSWADTAEEAMKIAVVDMGAGNKTSVQRAFRYVGAAASVTSDPDQIMNSDGLVLPGVGAFGPAMTRIKESGLDEVLRRYRDLGKPILGICLGMQLFFEKSFEMGETEGLGFIDGEVQKIQSSADKLPVIGWVPVDLRPGTGIFKDLDERNDFYHVHSYACQPKDDSKVIARSDHAGGYVSAVQDENVYGVQFHPEKSGRYPGLQLIKNFVEIAKSYNEE